MGKKRSYCPYCDVYLIHNSLRSRRDHMVGWKHVASMQAYYRRFLNIANDQNEQADATNENISTSAPKKVIANPTFVQPPIPKVQIVPPKISAPAPTIKPPSLSTGVTIQAPKIGPPSIGPPSIGLSASPNQSSMGLPRIGPSRPQIGPPQIGLNRSPILGPPKIGPQSPVINKPEVNTKT